MSAGARPTTNRPLQALVLTTMNRFQVPGRTRQKQKPANWRALFFGLVDALKLSQAWELAMLLMQSVAAAFKGGLNAFRQREILPLFAR